MRNDTTPLQHIHNDETKQMHLLCELSIDLGGQNIPDFDMPTSFDSWLECLFIVRVSNV